MGVREITDEFNKLAGPDKCYQTTMDYIDGGAKEKFTFLLSNGNKIELTAPPGLTPKQIAELALRPAG